MREWSRDGHESRDYRSLRTGRLVESVGRLSEEKGHDRLLEALGAAARNRMARAFSIEANVRRFEALYAALVNPTGAS